MDPLELLWRRELPIFHLRLAGCGGCARVVEEALCDTRRGRVRLLECFSPRHAGIVVVTGGWTTGLAGPACRVVGQAPGSSKLLLVGDCALGTDTLTRAAGDGGAAGCPLEADIEVEGCPVEPDALLEVVRDVAR